jgi:hypothetical protein
VVRLSLVEGNVQVLRVEESGWQEAQLNLPIRQGYTIATGNGRAEVEFESGATARLAENSTLEFRELALVDGGRMTHLAFSQGTATFYANLASNDSFIVSTPHIAVQIARNARFRLDVTADGTSLGVLKGEVNADALGNTYSVTKNRALHFRASDEQILLAKLGDEDAWDRWVSEREEILVASRNRVGRYVNTGGYSYGLSDLDRYGSWYNVPGYGWGWHPWGISAYWAPYSVGYWNYVYGIGLTWHSYEPWGWMPYHFGSWHFSHRHGWVWIPGYFDCWRPARVYYVWHNNRHHWGPLAPHDRPGHPPANLPHGTVTHSGPHPRRGGTGHITRADLMGNEPGISISYEPPQGFGGAVRPMRPTRAEGGVTSPARPAGFSGATPTPRGFRPEDRADLPRGGRVPRAGAPAGIVYDPQSGQYVNGPATTNRPSFDSPRGSTGNERPARPSQRPQWFDRPNTDESPAGTSRPSQPAWGNPARPTSPRTDSPSNTPPRGESPRPSAQPRNEHPRPAPPSNSGSGGWGGRPSSPPPPQPRTETPRPSPPPPRMESPRPSPPPRPSSSGSGSGWGGSSRPSSPSHGSAGPRPQARPRP